MDSSVTVNIKTLRLPLAGDQHLRARAKRSRKMVPSNSSSPVFRKSEKPSRSNTPPRKSSDELPELSDVQCYTCRRRHVKCDRQLPHCAKCQKKGVLCLGYQKPLRWADGVAVRGKLKGKAQPVVDSKVVDIVRNTIQAPTQATFDEAEHFGLHVTQKPLVETAKSKNSFMDLMSYHNSNICTERVTFEGTKFTHREIAPLSHELAQKLPREIVDCILGNAAVHRATRHPGNHEFERLALETKVNVYEGFNRLLQSPQDQLPDVLLCCVTLISSMDMIEHGMGKWLLHYYGLVNLLASFGGVENLVTFYSHLQLPLLQIVHFECFLFALSHIPLTGVRQGSRRVLEMLSQTPDLKDKFHSPCPLPLSFVLWEMGDCAQRIHTNCGPITFGEMHHRDQILMDVINFQPEDGFYNNETLREEAIYQDEFAISRLWKAAMTILVLRYLYFGRAELSPHSQQRSSTPSYFNAQPSPWLAPTEELGIFLSEGDFSLMEHSQTPALSPTYLSVDSYFGESLSRSPSPIPSPLLHTEPPISDLWDQRYAIHDEAFAVLSSTFRNLYESITPLRIRYSLLPLLILALVSRPGSEERALCLSYFDKLKDFRAYIKRPRGDSAYPRGKDDMDIELPWEQLDTFSSSVETERHDCIDMGEAPANCAPEWNWGDMLKYTDLNLAWPNIVGTAHPERDAEFWALRDISSVVNEDTFAVWTHSASSTSGSVSST